ncbi:hypothetical protein GQX74_011187 [Glossina fuscipes]|nr:hypothetical protein GQX74_011187 [Glossina fuscipes]
MIFPLRSARIKWGSFMATVCADSMALMDAAVLVSKPTARVAIGLVIKYPPYKLILKLPVFL